MTPEQKAKELVGIYLMSRVTIRTTLDSIPTRINGVIDFEDAKKLALIAVELILEGDHLLRLPLSYWQQVKTEIEKL